MQEIVSPAYQFTIPSLADGLPLDCRLYHPRSFGDGFFEASRPWEKRGAVVAHPYAPLGGCQDDPVVMAVVERLLEIDLVVLTFNFRGATGSKGSTSWTGKPERDDYTSSAGFLIHYLNQLRFCDVSESPSQARIEQDIDLKEGCPSSSPPPNDGIALILGGYSYGSLIVTQLPPISALLQPFNLPPPGSSAQETILRARSLAAQTNETLEDLCSRRGRQQGPPSTHHHKKSTSHHSITYGGRESLSSVQETSHGRRRSSDLPARIKTHMHIHRHGSKSTPRSGSHVQGTLEPPAVPSDSPRVRAGYLLISPLLPPLSGFLSFSFAALLLRSPEPRAFVENPTLVVFGSADGFTSARRVRAWCRRLEDRNAAFASLEVDGVGHFWRERGAVGSLCGSIEKWVGSHLVEHGSEGHSLGNFGTD